MRREGGLKVLVTPCCTLHAVRRAGHHNLIDCQIKSTVADVPATAWLARDTHNQISDADGSYIISADRWPQSRRMAPKEADRGLDNA